MKKILIIILAIALSTLTSYAARGFAAKVYDETNVHIMNILVDYDYNKIRVQTNNPDIDYIIISRISNIEKTILYIRAIPACWYNNGKYDSKKVETFVFDTKNNLLSTYNSTRKLRIDIYELERHL